MQNDFNCNVAIFFFDNLFVDQIFNNFYHYVFFCHNIINEIDEYTLIDGDGNILTDGYVKKYSRINK